MAKKKKVGRFQSLLNHATKAHQLDVGAGGNIFDPYMSNVRGIRLPGLGLMNVFNSTCLRDSCTIIVDGEWGSSKSSFSIDFFNWVLPYGGGGALIDCEQKAAFDIANGMLDEVSLW